MRSKSFFSQFFYDSSTKAMGVASILLILSGVGILVYGSYSSPGSLTPVSIFIVFLFLCFIFWFYAGLKMYKPIYLIKDYKGKSAIYVEYWESQLVENIQADFRIDVSGLPKRKNYYPPFLKVQEDGLAHVDFFNLDESLVSPELVNKLADETSVKGLMLANMKLNLKTVGQYLFFLLIIAGGGLILLTIFDNLQSIYFPQAIQVADAVATPIIDEVIIIGD